MEFMFDYIHNMILPSMVTETVGEDAEAMAQEQYNRELKKLLKTYHLSFVSLVTIYHWMIHLGYAHTHACASQGKTDITLTAMRNLQ